MRPIDGMIHCLLFETCHETNQPRSGCASCLMEALEKTETAAYEHAATLCEEFAANQPARMSQIAQVQADTAEELAEDIRALKAPKAGGG